jgi:acetylornithine deacetylase/succinyl-diaminopimelate desuccinylase-like protein
MNGEITKSLSKIIDSERTKILEFSLDLVKKPSETPPGDETGVSEVIRIYSSEWGLPEPEIWAKKKKRPNLIYRLKGNGKGKTLILNGHIDTKPIGDTTEWKMIDPAKPEIINNKLYGRGSVDMKGGIAGIIASAMAIKKSKAAYNGEIVLVLSADEEGGSSYGVKYLI